MATEERPFGIQMDHDGEEDGQPNAAVPTKKIRNKRSRVQMNEKRSENLTECRRNT